MTLSARTPSTARDRTTRAATAIRGLIRRMIVALDVGGLWQLEGNDGEVDADAPVFQGIGFASRPSAASLAAGNVEVITAKVGAESAHSVIIATRDESMRLGLEAGETAIFTAGAMVKITAAGEIEIGTRGGSFSSLALKADVQAIKTVLTTWTVAPMDGGAALKAKAITDLALVPAGTTKLKGM